MATDHGVLTKDALIEALATKRFKAYPEMYPTDQRVLRQRVLHDQWPLIVDFVATWMTENSGPDVDGLIARWREEMLNGDRPG